VNEDPLQRFRDAVSPQRQRISLTEAALMCAQDAYPDLDIRAQMGEIEQLGATLAKRLPPDFSTTHRLIALNNYLFGELGFAGNQDEYYDPRNSYMNEVLSHCQIGLSCTLESPNIVYASSLCTDDVCLRFFHITNLRIKNLEFHSCYMCANKSLLVPDSILV
jgi:hypothetical protein